MNRFHGLKRKHRLLISLLLFAITLIVYEPVKNFDFVDYDDPFYVTRNVPVQAGLTAKSIVWAFKAVEVGNWHPLTWLSHMLDCQFFALVPSGHHFTSVLLHATNAVLLFLLLCSGTGRVWPSALVALLFSIHPLNVESVAWVSERKNVLSTSFWLLTLGAYGLYARKPDWKRYSGMLVLFVLGLLAKAMLVTLPFVLLLLDYWPLQRRAPFRTLFGLVRSEQNRLRTLCLLMLEKVPMLLITVVSTWITYRTQQTAARPDLNLLFPFWFRIENALVSYIDYLWKALWPTKLAVFYPLLPLPSWRPLLAAVLLLLVTALIVKFRSNRYLPVGWFWYLGTLVPVIGVVQIGMQSKADRYAYVPLIGIFVIAAWALERAVQRQNRALYVIVPASLCAVLLLGWDTRVQLAYWRDSITLFSRALEVTPQNNYLSQMNLAIGLQEAGRYKEALPYLLSVEKHFPENPSLRNDLVSVFRELRMFSDAVQNGSVALHLTRDPRILARIHNNLGLTFSQMGQVSAAKEHFTETVHLDPSFFGAHLNLGLLFYNEGKFAEASAQARNSLNIIPTGDAYLLLGYSLLKDNRPAEAGNAFRAGLKISPENVKLQEGLRMVEQGSRSW